MVFGCESSLGDPVLGGPIVTEANNFGCIRWRPRTDDNAWWHDLSTGAYERRGKLWMSLPTPDVGMEAWGRFIASDPFYPTWLNREHWALFAGRYYGEEVAGFRTYLAGMEAMAERFKTRAEEAGWDI